MWRGGRDDIVPERNHLKHCAATALTSGDRAQAEAMYDEPVDLMYRNAR